jgi:hypothetical protein
VAHTVLVADQGSDPGALPEAEHMDAKQFTDDKTYRPGLAAYRKT